MTERLGTAEHILFKNVFQICLEITIQQTAQESSNKEHVGGQIISQAHEWHLSSPLIHQERQDGIHSYIHQSRNMAQNEGHDSGLQLSETCFKRFIFLAEPHELKKLKMSNKIIIIKFGAYSYVPDSVLSNLLVFLPFISSEK